ncbi:HD domain-containing protein [Candidatus Cardinium hertigii]|uniref:HD domain-containing protein n=1 Tax=Candidatus Cardinium hertigii TaxID=247481 RepID=UPI003D7C74E5
MHFNSFIFLLFLLVNLFVGIRSIRRPRSQHTQSTTANIIGAILAITYGGEVLCNSLNIDDLLRLAGNTISYFIIGNLLANRLYLFLSNGSLAETMGKLYGDLIRKIVAICGILHSASVAAIQFKLLSIAICWFFSIQANYSLIIAALFITFSVGSNNIQSLTLVRVVRCTTFGILLPMMAWTVWKHMVSQHHANQMHLALAIKRSWNSLIGVHTNPLDYISYFTVFAIPAFYPAQVERIVLSKNATQIKHSFNGAGFFSLSINLLLLWVALLVQKDTCNLMLSTVSCGTFATYMELKPLFMLGVAALTISTASANLHAATGLMANDLPNLFKWVKQPVLYQAIIGVMATLLSLYTKDQVIWMSIMLFKTVISVPLLLSLIGIFFHPDAVLIGMLTGGLTTIAWYCFESNLGMHGVLSAIGMNLLSSIAIQMVKRKQLSKSYHNILAQTIVSNIPPLWKQLCKYVLKNIKQFNLWDYLQKQLPRDPLSYILFSFYILLTGYGSFYTFSSNPEWYTTLESFVLIPSLFVVTFFLVYLSITPQSYIHKIASVVWPLSHIYFFFLVGTGMAILSKFAHIHNIIFMINLALAMFITPSVVVWFGYMISAMMAWIMFHYMSSITFITCFLDLNINIAYGIFMLFLLIGGLLYHNKGVEKLLSIIRALTREKEEQNAKQLFNKQQVEALAYESNCIISQLNNKLTRLEKPEERFLAYSEQAIMLKKYRNRIFNHLKHNLYLTTNWISIDQLLAECFDAIKMNNIYNVPYVIIDTKHLYIQCVIESIRNLIINSLYSCSAYNTLHNDQKKDIYIYIDDTKLGYRLTLLEGKLQKISAISLIITTDTRLPAIRPLYKVTEMADIQILDGNEEKTNSENQHIVHAHYGYYERFNSESAITHLYVIPVNVKEITNAFATLSPVVHTKRMVLDPISIQEEADFLEKVKQKKELDIDTVVDALQLIKVYYTIQRRKTGELSYLHPMAVASILLNITDDAHVIIAGLVHDVVQNTPLTEAGLTTLFGHSITQIVRVAAHLEKELPSEKDNYATYIEAIIRNKNHDAILVRLADVLHNARTISGHTVEKQIEKARLIQKFYLPLAIQMQLVHISHELELHIQNILNIAMVKH